MVNNLVIDVTSHHLCRQNHAMDIDDPMTTDQEDSSYPDSSALSSEECCPFAVKNLSGDQGIADTVVRRGSEVQAPAHPVTVDDGIEEPVNLDYILRAEEYYGEMDRLAHETAESCRIDLVLTELSSLSKTHCLIILWGCHESMDRLRRESFCHSFFSIFVEDISRGVAETVYISMEEIELLIACIEKRVEYSDETQEQLVEELAARLRLCDVDNVFGQVEKALALGLVSFSVSHANRFDVELFSEDMGRINIGPRLGFSIRELACLDRFIGGPVWILGRSNSTSKLKLFIQVKHFDRPDMGANLVLGGWKYNGPKGLYCQGRTNQHLCQRRN